MKKLCFGFVCVIFSLFFTFSLDANDSIITNVVLNAENIPGIDIVKMAHHSWWYPWNNVTGEPIDRSEITEQEWLDTRHGKEGKLIKNLGVVQFACINENELPMTIYYIEFPTHERALHALGGSRTNLLFQGVWPNATQKKIGDASWYYDLPPRIKLLVLKNSICFEILYHNEDDTVRRSTSEQVALKILEKIEQGGHVILSTENPPPVTAPTSPPSP